MKFLSTILIFTFLIIGIKPIFAIEKSSINLEKNPSIINTYKNIKQAKLIESEVVNFRKKLIIIQKKYNLEKDKTINSSLKDLTEIIYILRKIQTTRLNKNTANYIINTIVSDLKIINTEIKSYLKKIKSQFVKINIKYSKIATVLNLKLNKIIYSFLNHYLKKTKLNTKDKKILNILTKLNNESIKLKNFKNNNFSNEKEVKIHLVNILKEIKMHFREIKNTLKR